MRPVPRSGIFFGRLCDGRDSLAKAIREKIRLVSSAGTGYFYTTTKNRRTHPDKVKCMKYDPRARKHVEFVEHKMK